MLDRVPLIDGHNDLAWIIRRDPRAPGDVGAYALEKRRPKRESDIPRLREGKVSAQFWAAFIPSGVPHPARTTLEQIEIIRRMNALHPADFLPALRSTDVARARREGRIASFIAVENGEGLENSLALLGSFHALGVRYLTLCHNDTLDWVDSATDLPRHGGLTAFGRDVVREMNRLGMMVDLSHTTTAVMHQALSLSVAPVAITHSNARALCDHPRNTPDDVLIRLRHNGGIIMATFVPDFTNQAVRDWWRPLEEGLGRRRSAAEWDALVAAREAQLGPSPVATLSQVCDHLEYLIDRAGIEHVGIGSDFYGGITPEGLHDVSRFPHLFAEMLRRGWSEADLALVAGGNFLRAFRGVERAAGET